MLVLDSGGVSWLAGSSEKAVARIIQLRRRDHWPPTVPSAVLVECLTGRTDRDAKTSRFLKSCELRTELPDRLARRAALLRFLAQRGSAVDAIVVAMAEPGGVVLTGDTADLGALAGHASDVVIEPV